MKCDTSSLATHQGCCPAPLHPQAINSIARELDRDGSRTIGVITKPDAIAPGTHPKWLALARNQVCAAVPGGAVCTIRSGSMADACETHFLHPTMSCEPSKGMHHCVARCRGLCFLQVPSQALSHGYYVVKNPGQDQLDKAITFREARKASGDAGTGRSSRHVG